MPGISRFLDSLEDIADRQFLAVGHRVYAPVWGDSGVITEVDRHKHTPMYRVHTDADGADVWFPAWDLERVEGAANDRS